MAAFNLTAQLNLVGPTNVRQVVADIRRQIGTIQGNVDLGIDPKTTRTIAQINAQATDLNRSLADTGRSGRDSASSLNQLNKAAAGGNIRSMAQSSASASKAIKDLGDTSRKSAKSAKILGNELAEFGRQSGLAIRRFAAFSLVSGVMYKLNSAVNQALSQFIDFDREVVRLSQVTGKSVGDLGSLTKEISRLSTATGVASEDLIKISSTLAQAGLSARDTEKALQALALSANAPSFDNLNNTVEGSIALMRQFGISTRDLEKALGSINAVSAAFAVEAGDIISAISRTGGVFASASKGVSQGIDALNEFIAVFTSVRATTRESAETIATGLRTIFTRIQRSSTVEALQELGVQLRDVEGKFVGPYEAVRRLSEGLGQLDPRSEAFAAIVEELGGFRQIGKVIPLIQQFATAEAALNVAMQGGDSLAEANRKAQQSLAVQLAKTREEFVALIRDFANNTVFRSFLTNTIGLTKGLLGLARAGKALFPLLTIIGGFKAISGITQFAGGFAQGVRPSGGKGGGAKGIGQGVGEALTGAKSERQAAALEKIVGMMQSNVSAFSSDMGALAQPITALSSNIQQNIISLNDNTSALNASTAAINALISAINNRGGSATLYGGGRVLGFNSGGVVPGSGKGDSVPALLEPGEVVMSNRAVSKYGRGNLVRMNKYADGSMVSGSIQQPRKKFAEGGLASLQALAPGQGSSHIAQAIQNQDRLQDKDRVSNKIIRTQLSKKDIETKLGGTDQFKDTLDKTRRQKYSKQNYQPGLGFAFEDFVLNNLRVIGLSENYSKPSKTNYPVDLIPTGRASPVEIKYKNESEPDPFILNKHFRYLLDTNKWESRKFTRDIDNKPPVNIGTIRVVELTDGTKDELYYPNGVSAKVLEERERRAEKRIAPFIAKEHINANQGGKIQKFMSGSAGGVKPKPEPFGTGVTKFPRRISNAYARQIEKEETARRFDKLIQRSPINERIMVDEAMEQQIAQGMQQPLDREQFVASFKRVVLRDEIASNISNFAKLVGLPQEDLSVVLPRQLDFGSGSGPIGSRGDTDILGGNFSTVRPYGSRGAEGWDLSEFGYTKQDEQDLFGFEKLLKEKEKERTKIRKTPIRAVDDGRANFDLQAHSKATDEYNALNQQIYDIRTKRDAAISAANKAREEEVASSGRATLGFGTMFGKAENPIFYHELTHQLFKGLRAKSADSFDKYKQRVTTLFETDNDGLADAFDALNAGYNSADVVYGRSYKLDLLGARQRDEVRKDPAAEDVKNLASLIKSGSAAKKATEFRPINPSFNEAMLKFYSQEHLDKVEDNGKEEFLTTLIEKMPVLDQRLQGILDSTMTELLAGAGIQRQKYATGGFVQRFVGGGKTEPQTEIFSSSPSPMLKAILAEIAEKPIRQESSFRSYQEELAAILNQAYKGILMGGTKPVKEKITRDSIVSMYDQHSGSGRYVDVTVGALEDDLKYITGGDAEKGSLKKRKGVEVGDMLDVMRSYQALGLDYTLNAALATGRTNETLGEFQGQDLSEVYTKAGLDKVKLSTFVKQMNAAAQFKFPEKLYSGLGDSKLDLILNDTDTKTKKDLDNIVGKTFTMPSFLSASDSEAIAGSFARVGMLTILTNPKRKGIIPEKSKQTTINRESQDERAKKSRLLQAVEGQKGFAGLIVDESYADAYDSEGEYIFPSNSKFKINYIEKSTAKLFDKNAEHKHLDMEVQQLAKGGFVQQFVDGGWVERMKKQPKSVLESALQKMQSAAMFADDTGAYVPSFNETGSLSEAVSPKELKERFQALSMFLTGKDPLGGRAGAGRKRQSKFALKDAGGYNQQELLDAVLYYQGGSGPLARAMVHGDYIFVDREEAYDTEDVVNRLKASAQYQAPKKLYSGLGRGQYGEILKDAKIHESDLVNNPDQALAKLQGQTIDFPTFLSTSTLQKVAKTFIGDPGAFMSIDASQSEQKVLDILKAKKTSTKDVTEKGSRRLPGIDKLSDVKLSGYDLEKEFVLPPSVKFRINSAKIMKQAATKVDDEGLSQEDYYAQLFDQPAQKPFEYDLSKLADIQFGEGSEDFDINDIDYGKSAVTSLGSVGFDLPKLDLKAQMLARGGAIQRLMEGGVAQRKLGYIDYDVIANPANEGVVSKGMQEVGIDGPRLYFEKLVEMAVQARKEQSLNKLRAIYGVAGAGKTTLARGQGTDKGTLRETQRFPILTPEDIQKATEVLLLSSTVSKDKLDTLFADVDRAYTLSSTTPEEKEKIKAQIAGRDVTGVGAEGRAPGSTTGAPKDTAVGEALLADRLGDRSVVLGRTESGRLRRKRGDELVEIVKKRIGMTWGGFAPMTAGHESILDAAAAMGISPQDFVFLVGANESIKLGDPSSYRTAVFNQDARVLLAKAGAGARGATVVPKAADFEVPLGVDISEQTGRRKVLLPGEGSTVFVADKTEQQTAKYKAAGYNVSNIERTGGISGTMVRDLIMAGNMAELQKVLSPGVYELISNNIGRIQNRANVLPDIVEQVKQSQGVKLAEVERAIKALGISRIDPKKMEDPEYAAKVEVLEQLRSQRDKIKKSAAFEPYRLLDKLARSQPEQYALDLNTPVSATAAPIRTVSQMAPAMSMAATTAAVESAAQPPIEIPPELTQYGKIGMEAIPAIKAGTPIEDAVQARLAEVLKDLGGAAGIRDLGVNIPLDLKTKLRLDNLRSGKLKLKPVADVLNRAQEAKAAKGAAEAAEKLRREGVRKVALAGLQPLNYSRDPEWELSDGRKYIALTRGFKSVYLQDIERFRTRQKEAAIEFAKDTTATEAIGFLGQDKAPVALRPLAIDFDDTLAFGTKMLNAEGKEDISAYYDEARVREVLSKATPTRLAERLAEIESKQPGTVRAYTRVLTARAESLKHLVTETLNRFGLPYIDSDITGVGAIGDNDRAIARKKADNLSQIDRFIDDSEKNIASAQTKGIDTYRYAEPKAFTNASDYEPFGAGNIEGALLEQALAMKIGRKIDFEALEQNRALDFPGGLGAGASLFGLPPNIETEIKRTLDKNSFAKARSEFDRYFTENPGKYSVGGLVTSFADGGSVSLYHGANTGVDDNVLKSFQEKGALSGIAQGYGQGAGFYVFSQKSRAKQQAERRVNDASMPAQGDRSGKPMVLTFNENLNADTWDLDYELNKATVTRWLADNYDRVKNLVQPTATANERLTGIREVLKPGDTLGGRTLENPVLRIQSDLGKRANIEADNDANLNEGMWLGQIMSRLQANDTAAVHAFEQEFFSSVPNKDVAIKYVGSSPLKPTNIETFADGGTVPALVSNGEAYVPPKLAKRIGYGTLNKMNQADRNGMGRFSQGGISVFKGPGSGTSDSIPTRLPVGSFIIREKATKALGFNRGGAVGIRRFADGGTPNPLSLSRGIDLGPLTEFWSIADAAGTSLREFSIDVMNAANTARQSALDQGKSLAEANIAAREAAASLMRIEIPSLDITERQRQEITAGRLTEQTAMEMNRAARAAADLEVSQGLGVASKVQQNFEANRAAGRTQFSDEGKSDVAQAIQTAMREQVAFIRAGASARGATTSIDMSNYDQMAAQFDRILSAIETDSDINKGVAPDLGDIQKLLQELRTARSNVAADRSELPLERFLDSAISSISEALGSELTAAVTPRPETGVDFQKTASDIDIDARSASDIGMLSAAIDAQRSLVEQINARNENLGTQRAELTTAKAGAATPAEAALIQSKIDSLDAEINNNITSLESLSGVIDKRKQDFADRFTAATAEVKKLSDVESEAQKSLDDAYQTLISDLAANADVWSAMTDEQKAAAIEAEAAYGDVATAAEALAAAQRARATQEAKMKEVYGEASSAEDVISNIERGTAEARAREEADRPRREAEAEAVRRGEAAAANLTQGRFETDEDFKTRQEQESKVRAEQARRSSSSTRFVSSREQAYNKKMAQQSEAEAKLEDKKIESQSRDIADKSTLLLIQALNENTKSHGVNSDSLAKLESATSDLANESSAAATARTEKLTQESEDLQKKKASETTDADNNEVVLPALDMLEGLGDRFNKFGDNIANSSIAVNGEMTKFARGIQSGSRAVSNALYNISDGIKQANTAFANTGFGKFAGAFGKYGTQIGAGVTMATQYLSDLAGNFDTTSGTVLQFTSTIAAQATTMGTLGAQFGLLGGVIGTVIGAAKGFVDSLNAMADAARQRAIADLESAKEVSLQDARASFELGLTGGANAAEDFTAAIQSMSQLIQTENALLQQNIDAAPKKDTSIAGFFGFGSGPQTWKTGEDLRKSSREMAAARSGSAGLSSQMLNSIIRQGNMSLDQAKDRLGPQGYDAIASNIALGDSAFIEAKIKATQELEAGTIGQQEYTDKIYAARDAAVKRATASAQAAQADEEYRKTVTEVRKRLESQGGQFIEDVIRATPKERGEMRKNLVSAEGILRGDTTASRAQQAAAAEKAYRETRGTVREKREAAEQAKADVRGQNMAMAEKILSFGDQSNQNIRNARAKMYESMLREQGIDPTKGMAAEVIGSLRKKDPELDARDKNTEALLSNKAAIEALTEAMKNTQGDNLLEDPTFGGAGSEAYKADQAARRNYTYLGGAAVVGTAALAGADQMFNQGRVTRNIGNRARNIGGRINRLAGGEATPDVESAKRGRDPTDTELSAEDRRRLDADIEAETRRAGSAAPGAEPATPKKKRGWWPFGGGGEGASTPKPRGSGAEAPKPRFGGSASGGRRGVQNALAMIGLAGTAYGASQMMGGDETAAGGETEALPPDDKIVMLLAAIENNTRACCMGGGGGMMMPGGGMIMPAGMMIPAAMMASVAQPEPEKTVSEALSYELGTSAGLMDFVPSAVADTIGVRSALSDIGTPAAPTTRSGLRNPGLMGGLNVGMQLVGAGMSYNAMQAQAAQGNYGYAANEALGVVAGGLNAAGGVTGGRAGLALGMAGDTASFARNTGRLLSGQSLDQGTIGQDIISAGADALQVGAQGAALAPQAAAKAVEKVAAVAAPKVAAPAMAGLVTRINPLLATADIAFGGYRGATDENAVTDNVFMNTALGMISGSSSTGGSVTGQLYGAFGGEVSETTDEYLAQQEAGLRGASIGYMLGGPAGAAAGYGVGVASETVKVGIDAMNEAQNARENAAKTARMTEESKTTKFVADESGNVQKVAKSENAFDYGIDVAESSAIRAYSKAKQRRADIEQKIQSGGDLSQYSDMGSTPQEILQAAKNQEASERETFEKKALERTKSETWYATDAAKAATLADFEKRALQFETENPLQQTQSAATTEEAKTQAATTAATITAVGETASTNIAANETVVAKASEEAIKKIAEARASSTGENVDDVVAATSAQVVEAQAQQVENTAGLIATPAGVSGATGPTGMAGPAGQDTNIIVQLLTNAVYLLNCICQALQTGSGMTAMPSQAIAATNNTQMIDSIIKAAPSARSAMKEGMTAAQGLLKGDFTASRSQQTAAGEKAYRDTQGTEREKREAAEQAKANVRQQHFAAAEQILSLGDPNDANVRNAKANLRESMLKEQGIDPTQGIAAEVIASIRQGVGEVGGEIGAKMGRDQAEKSLGGFGGYIPGAADYGESVGRKTGTQQAQAMFDSLPLLGTVSGQSQQDADAEYKKLMADLYPPLSENGPQAIQGMTSGLAQQGSDAVSMMTQALSQPIPTKPDAAIAASAGNISTLSAAQAAATPTVPYIVDQAENKIPVLGDAGSGAAVTSSPLTRRIAKMDEQEFGVSYDAKQAAAVQATETKIPDLAGSMMGDVLADLKAKSGIESVAEGNARAKAQKEEAMRLEEDTNAIRQSRVSGVATYGLTEKEQNLVKSKQLLEDQKKKAEERGDTGEAAALQKQIDDRQKDLETSRGVEHGMFWDSASMQQANKQKMMDVQLYEQARRDAQTSAITQEDIDAYKATGAIDAAGQNIGASTSVGTVTSSEIDKALSEKQAQCCCCPEQATPEIQRNQQNLQETMSSAPQFLDKVAQSDTLAQAVSGEIPGAITKPKEDRDMQGNLYGNIAVAASRAMGVNLPASQITQAANGVINTVSSTTRGPAPEATNAVSGLSQLFDTAALGETLQKSFGDFLANLQNIQLPKIPDVVTMEGRHTVEVIINGAEALKSIEPMIVELIDTKLGELKNNINNITEGGFGP